MACAANIISKIIIKNIKGKERMVLDKFTHGGIIANYANILVAHNGFGKSTMSTAFEALQNNKIKLDEKDRYYKDHNAVPTIEVEVNGEKDGIYIADESHNDFFKNKIHVGVIKSPLYAKDTSKQIRGFNAKSADIRVKTIEICKVVKSVKLDYSVKDYAKSIGVKHTQLINYKKYLNDLCFWEKILNQDELLKKYNGIKVKKIMDAFLKYPTQENAKKAYENKNIYSTILFINELEDKSSVEENVELLYKVAQLFEFYNKNKQNIKKYVKYLKYKKIKNELNEDLKLFDTTNKKIRCKEKNDELIIVFGTANDMSNGERDVLSFIGNLKKYELDFNSKYGLLIIDEVFDYLDGANMLAVQFYLQKFINRVRNKERIIFPIILTHLDPIMFNNYYLKKQRIHYIETIPHHEVDTGLLKLLIDRSNKTKENDEDIINFVKAFIHYFPGDVILGEKYGSLSKDDFYKDLKDNIEKCCSYNEFDSLKVVAAIRVMIEKYLYEKLDDDNRSKIIDEHKTANKILFAEKHGVDIPFEFYLLAPVYNDPLHINEKNKEVKIKSCYLKMCNGQIKNIIKSMKEKCV